MTIMDMLGQSGTLTLLGMGIVFSFLALLICAVTIMGKILGALETSTNTAAKTGSNAAGTGDASVTAAISAAVNEYRKSN